MRKSICSPRSPAVRLVILAILVGACGDDAPGGEPGHFTISGVIRYEDRPQLTSGSLGPATPKPARAVQVAVVRETGGAVLGMTVADDDGAYTIDFDGNDGEMIHILAAATNVSATRPVSVQNAATKKLHGFGGAAFATANTTTADVLVTEASGEGAAFNIFDTLLDVMDRLPTLFPGKTVQPLTANWHDGNDDGTYYFESGLFLLGQTADSDGYDDTVIFHESGHWIEDIYGRSDSNGGDHDGSPTDPNLAWSEGFATYFSMAMTNQPIYGDSNANGGFAYNGDTSVTKAVLASGLAQNVSEDMVTEILWDMGDAPATDDDGIADTHVHVIQLEQYMRDHPLRIVGKPGVDLVDALDAWFIQFGLTSCAGMRAIVNTSRLFPYDYGSSAGVCP